MQRRHSCRRIGTANPRAGCNLPHIPIGAPLRNFLNALLSWGPWGVLLLAILDSGGIPIVGGVDAFVVVVAALDHSQAYWAAAAAIAGSVIGSLFLFFIARKGGEAYLHHHTLSSRGQHLRAWFLEYGLLTVFVPAFVPVIPMPVKIFILSAGALGVSPVTFYDRADGCANSTLCVPGVARDAVGQGDAALSAPAYLGVHYTGCGIVCDSVFRNSLAAQPANPAFTPVVSQNVI